MADEAQVPPEAEKTETTSQTWYAPEFADVVQRTGWKDPNDAVKSYRELEKSSSAKVKLPDEKATPEERQKFYQKLGCPEKPEGYEIKLDDTFKSLRDENIENRMKAIAHKNGLPKQAFEGLVGEYYKAQAEQFEQSRQQGEQQLKQELGDKYDEEVKIAQRFTQNCSDDFKKFLEDSGLGNHPVFVKEFMRIGKLTLDDKLIKGDTSNPDTKEYKPKYPDSPEMYRLGEDQESVKAREWFVRNKGYKY